MSPFGVIEGLDVFKYGRGGLLMVLVNGIAYPFAFQATEKPLHTSIVPAVAFAAHTALHFK